MAQSIKRKGPTAAAGVETTKPKKQKTGSRSDSKSGQKSAKSRDGKAAKAVNRQKSTDEEEARSEEEGFDGFTSEEDPDEAEAGAADGAGDANKSKESHKKQKELAAQRRASKPNADDIATAKKLWERLRLKSHISKDERQKLVGQLFDIVTGRVHDFVFKHDSVRVVQCAVKYATIAQKRAIAEELKGSFRTLAESKYAKFLLAKLITEGDDETKEMIIPEFYGHVRRLINHPEASWVLDDIYRSVASTRHKAIMLRELYGPEFAVFKAAKDTAVTSSLPQILETSPEKRTAILLYLLERINQLIQKKMTGFTILHDAILQYLRVLDPESEDFSALIRLIIGDKNEEETDLLRNLAFTCSGSEIVCLALAHGSAKDRRQILKAYKDVFEMLAYDKDGHKVLLAAFEVLDDTREILQRLYSEIILLTKTATAGEQDQKIVSLSTNPIGQAVLLYPYIGAERKLLIPHTLALMQKVRKIRQSSSKKDPIIRRTELITPISPLFLHAIEAQAADIISTSFGCVFVTEIIMNGVGEKAGAASAIAQAVQGDPSQGGHVAHSPFTGKMLKTLIAGGPFNRQLGKVVPLDPPLGFPELLMQNIGDYLSQWILGDGGFVVLALLEASWVDLQGLSKVQNAVAENKHALELAVKREKSMEDDDDDKVAQIRRYATSARHLLATIR